MGFEYSAKVVTAVALIMICVFAGFMSSTDSVIAALGLGLAVAVALDAYVVRMINIEGERLAKSPAAGARPEPATELSTRH